VIRLLGSGFVSLCVLALAAVGCEATDDDAGGADAGNSGDTFTSVFSRMSSMCAGCHAPGAAGFVDGTEATMNWSSKSAAYASLKGTASGLTGNFADCNGVPLIGANAGSSLVVASLDEDVRTVFDVAGFPNCDMTTISDMTLKIGGPLNAQLLADLKSWIDNGAADD
jgi:hypothetical protein